MFDYRTASPLNYNLLKAFAKENRNHATEAENVLWESLKGKRLEGKKFLRQHIIGDYIVDFVCQENGLIIEVDGGYHAEKSQQDNDAIRTAALEEDGFRVIRFTNEEVLFDIDHVIETIINNL